MPILGTYPDQDDTPAERTEACLNCGKMWESHFGWKCGFSVSKGIRKTVLPPSERYLTPDMQEEAVHTGHPLPHLLTLPPSHPVDLSDWRVWRDIGKDPEHCACKIHKSQCKFHRD